MTEREELIWLAGLLEGEGSFYLAKNHYNDRRYPIVQLETTDRDVVDHAARIVGAKVYSYQPTKPPGRKCRYRVRVGWSRARTLMDALLPFMGERRSSKIREVLNG